MIFAQNGQFLGIITRNPYSSNSIANKYGTYGSRFSGNSIFNTFGQYGSTFSSLSPWNPAGSQPPMIVINNQAVAYLSKNPARSPRVDLDTVTMCIGRAQ